MRQVLLILAVTVMAMGFVAASVFGLRDRRVLVPAPENETEGFLDLFAKRRHEQALSRLTTSARDTMTVEALSKMHARIADRIGSFELESTSRQRMTDERASASGALKGERGDTLTVAFQLQREKGIWRITDLRPLADAAAESRVSAP